MYLGEPPGQTGTYSEGPFYHRKTETLAHRGITSGGGREGGSRNKGPAGGEDVFRWKVLECVTACPRIKSQRKLQLNPAANAVAVDVAGSRTIALAF